MKKRVWIKADLLDWPTTIESAQGLDSSNWQRAYEIWNHASTKINYSATEMDKVDAITTLKRCVNQRLKQFEKVYKIRQFLNQTNIPYLKLLEQLGLVRPLLLQYLMEIRNEIEHDDRKPPKLERCFELLDVVWYFLKSTDTLMKQRTSNIEFQPKKVSSDDEESKYWVTIDVDIKRNWKLTARGWIPEEYVSTVNESDYLELMVDEFKNSKELEGELNKNNTDFYFIGSIVKLPDRLKFARLYLSVYL
jgi:hypothetical protein